MKTPILTTTGAAALLMLSQSAEANTLVSTIVGAYDNLCASVTCAPSKPATGISNFASNGGNPNDTPSLFIYNTTGSSFTNVSLKLTGYNGINNGVVTVVNPGNIGAHTVFKLIWGNGDSNSLFAYDYDDEKGGLIANSKSPITPSSGGAPVCDAQGFALCAQVGNFDVAFSATLDSNPISSNFSDNPGGQNGSPTGFGNVPNTFVPWEGMSPEGWSESFADDHSGTTPGILADIFTGTNVGQTNPNTPVPEPGTLAVFGIGLGALALTRRRKPA